MRSGRKSEAQTPAPKKDRIYGSERNKKGSASSSKKASNIEFTESTIKTLENKRDEYNAKHPNAKVTLATLKAVFRRGAGAFSSSHRPNMTRSGWAFARVNKFLLKKGGTKVKAAYVQDDDLMERGGVILRQEYSGKDVKKYLGNSNYQDDSFFHYIKNTDKYILDNVDIHSVVMRDSSLFDFINQYKDTLRANENEWEWHNKFPIVIGDNAYDKNIVLDGYHRITQAIVNNENEILAFVKKKKYEEGGLIAPNGKKSNLTPEQYRLVRTPEFKAWFGDWENDPQNASKVVDENGEPLVVYRGWSTNFKMGNTFKYNKNLFENRSTNKFGFYFTENIDIAKEYAKDFADAYNSTKQYLDYSKIDIAQEIVEGYFLNIRNLFDFSPINKKFPKVEKILDDYTKLYIREYGEITQREATRIESNEKYQYGTSIGFQSLYKMIGLKTKIKKLNYGNRNNVLKPIYSYFINEGDGIDVEIKEKLRDDNYDGLRFQESTHYYYILTPKERKEVDKNAKLNIAPSWPFVYVAFNSNQIKLADGSNTTFNAKNPDIRYEDGGLIDALTMGMANLKKNGIVLTDNDGGITLIAYNTGNQERQPSLYNKALIYSSVQPIKSASEIIQNFDLQDFEMFSEGKMEEYKKSHLIIMNQNEVVYDSSVLAEGGDLGQEITCVNCGWHWNTNNSDEFDKYVCHKCGFDNRTFYDSDPIGIYKNGGNIESDAFRNWFLNSKVVDPKGNPLIVYHGSPDLRGLKSDYIFKSRFENNQSFFFTDNYRMAKSYADPTRAFDYQNAEEGVVGLYLSIQNPLIVNAENQVWRKFETEINGEKIVGTRSLIEYAKNEHDGVIVKNVRDYYQDNEKKASGGNVYVVFKPTQIKLADGSNTTFDGDNPDIRYEEGGDLDEQPQMYIDIISMNPTLEKYQKYKDILKNKFGIDYDVQYGNNDEKLIEDANLDDLKYKDDFLNYDNYVKYANKIFKLRGFINNQPTHIEGIVNIDLASKIGEELGFYVELKPYMGSGNYAEALGKVIRMPNEVDVNTFIHEIGHYFDHQYSKEYDGDAKNSIYATSLYYLGRSDEVFAENFMIYFIAPTWLKNNMPNVYYELHEKIPENYKNTINNLIHQVGYKEGGNLPVGKLAKGMTEEEVAQIHGLHEKDIKNELLLGIEQEMEHTDNPIYAKAIALDHLYENPKYYTKLKEMEKSFKNGGYFSDRYPKNEYIQLSNDDVNDFKEDIFNIINSSYAYIGGHIEFQKPDDIVNSDLNFWIGADIDEDPEVDTIIGGKTTNFGTKLTASAQDGSRNAKISVMKKMGELLATKGFYAETNVDLAIKRGGKWETDEEIIRKVVNKPDIVMNEDGSYTRNIGGHPHTKVLVGYFDHLKEKKYKRGGELDPDNKGVKDYFAGGSGSTGGVLVGKRHSEGGIKAINKSTNSPIEMEGGEVVITRNAVSDGKKREFEGQMLTNKEILSKINVSGGGVSLYEDGGKVGCSFCTGKKYKYGGEMVSDYQIYDEVMRSGGDLALDRKYGSMSYQDSNDIDDYNYDEQEIIYHFLRTDADYVYIDKDNVRNIKGLINKGLFNYRETNGNYNVEVYPTKLGKKVLSEMPVEAFKRGGNLSNRKNIIIDTNDGRSKRKKLEDYYASIQEDKQFASGGTIDGLEDLSSCSRSFLVDMKNSGLEYLDYSADRKKEIKDLEDNDLIYFTNSSSFGCVTAFLTKKGKQFISSVPTHLFKKGGINDCGCGCGSYKDGGETDAEKKYFKGISYDYENQFLVNKAIEELLNMKDSNDMTIDEKNFLTYYSGYGGLEKYGASGKGLLYEYFTPSLIAKKMWALAYKHGFEGGFVLEPSCGIGEFIKYAPEQQMVQGYEINETSAKISKILYPKANIKVEPFEKMFIKNNYTIKGQINGMNKYSLVIGNPPYGSMGGLYAGMGEKDYAKANNYIDYFILRGLDLLQSGGLLVFIIGVEVAAGGVPYLEQGVTENKKLVSKIADLVDAYRLPNGVFERTDVLTDIVVFKKK